MAQMARKPLSHRKPPASADGGHASPASERLIADFHAAVNRARTRRIEAERGLSANTNRESHVGVDRLPQVTTTKSMD
jgi:hypothetical protein